MRESFRACAAQRVAVAVAVAHCAVAVALCVGVGVGVGGCAFSDDVPAGAVLYCSADAECPSPQACNALRHVCVDPDAEAPLVLSITVDPPAASDGVVELRVESNALLDPLTAPLVEMVAGTPALPWTPGTTDATAQTLVLDAAAVDEGGYGIATVTVTDVDGNVGTRAADVSVIIDRSAPVLRNVVIVDAPPGGVFADVAPENVVHARFLSSEQLASASIAAGALAEACDTSGAGLDVDCTLTLDALAGDGATQLSLGAVDDAGNESRVALDIDIDTRPPSVVVDSVTLSVETAGVPTAFVRPNSTVTLSFIADEALGAAPAVSLDVDGSPFAFALLNVVGRAASFRFTPQTPIPDGSFFVDVALVDVFGHASPLTRLALPEPFAAGIPFVAAGAPSVCPAPAQSGVTCIDADADGFFAQTGCGGAADLDDSDPLTRPGAVERPGDGVDNDGVGGDGVIDETAGVFVDSLAGDDLAGDGTRAAPFRTLAPSAATGAPTFLAARAEPYVAAGGGEVGNILIGGLDPVTWTRTSARSVVEGTFGFALLIDAIETDGEIGNSAPGGTVARSRVSRIGLFQSGNFVVDSVVGTITAAGSGIHVLRSTIGTVLPSNGMHFDRDLVDLIQVDSAAAPASIIITNSVLTARAAPAVNCLFGRCGNIEIYHSTLLAIDPARSSVIAVQGVVPSIRIVGTSFVGLTDAPLIDAGSASSITLVDNNFFSPGQTLLVAAGAPATLADINACAFASCAGSASNTAVDPASGLDATLPDGSPLIDRDIDALALGAPTSVVVDLVGDCRYLDGSADVGADEHP